MHVVSNKKKKGFRPLVSKMVVIDLESFYESLLEYLDLAVEGSPNTDRSDKETLVDLLLRDMVEVQRNPDPAHLGDYLKSVSASLKDHYIDESFIDGLCLRWISLSLFFTAKFVRNKCHDITPHWSIAKVLGTSVYIYPINAVEYRPISRAARAARRTMRLNGIR